MSTLRPRNQACGTALRACSLRRLGWTTSLRTPPGEASTPSRSWIARCQDSACVALRAGSMRPSAWRKTAVTRRWPARRWRSVVQLAGEHRQAQAARAARGPAVVDRAQSQCAPEGAEDGLQVGPRHAGAPQPLGVPADAAGAQAVDPGMGRPAALQRLPLPGHRCRVAAPVVGLHVDRAVRGGGRMAGLQPSDALPDLRHAPGRALARQALVQRPQSRLEARAGLPRHRPLLLRPLRGRAAQARLAVPVRLGAGQHALPAGRRVRGRRHGLQRAALGDVAGQDPGAAREAAGVQHQAQRERRTVVALLPGMVAAGQRLLVRRDLEARAGQVVQGDGGLEETRLDRVAVAQQAVAGALGGRRGHAADEVAEDGGALRTGQAQLLEQGRRTELPHGPQGDVLDADRARADQLQGVDVDPRQIGRRVVGAVGRGRRAHGGDAGLHQLGGAALGLVLDRGGAGPELEGALGGEDALDAGAQRRPAPARQGDVAAEALGEVGLLAPGAGAGGGPADEQAPMGAGPGAGVK